MTKYHLRVVREGVGDPRVHALLYFLPPTGHGVRWRSLLEIKINRAPPISIPTCRAVDIETMKRLHDKVNLFSETSWRRWLVKVILIKWFFATFGRLPIVWSAGELDSPDRQGGFFHQGGAAGVQTKCNFSSFPRILRKDKRFYFANSSQICNQLASEKILFHNFTTCRNQVEGTNHVLHI